MPITESPPFATDEMRIFSLLRDAGFSPKVVFDIGAANGTWSALISQIFPDATFHLFEPLAEVREDYRDNLRYQMDCHPNFALHSLALGACRMEVEMCIHDNGYGSTILDMGEHPDFRKRIRVQQDTLDDYVSRNRVALPSVIKIDTQGSELLILSHAPTCLRQTQVIFAETWLTRGYGPETPLLTELAAMLSGRGFVLTELGHRFYDERHEIYGCDAFFLRRDFLESVVGSMPPETW